MRVSRVSNERGVALAVAIFALVVIGALVAGTFFAGRLEQQTGQNSMFAIQAGQVAEAGLADAIVTEQAATLDGIAVNPTGAATGITDYSGPSGSHMSATRSIKRLSTNLFLFQVVGTKTDGSGNTLATQTLAQLVRLNYAPITVNAGLTALGNVKISGGAFVQGNDAIPSAWTGGTLGVDCPTLTNQTGVRYNGGTVTKSGGGDYDGTPPSTLDPTLSATSMKQAFDQLKGLATLTLVSNNPPDLAPAYTGNPVKCNTGIESNWGEPTPVDKNDPCFSYYPIIYHNGNLKLQGGRGQGILLVEGDLTTTGSVVFYGPVFVTGTLSTSGNSGQGAKFYGGVIAGNVDLDDITKLAGGALVNFSSCALERALRNSATVSQVGERSWIQLYN